VLVSDLMMPEMSGLELLTAARRVDGEMGVVLITAFGTVDKAVAAMRAGADDFLQKPVDLHELRERVSRALEIRALKGEVRVLREKAAVADRPGGMIGRTPALLKVLERARLVADTDAGILVTGESGTGKELLARYLHDASPRAGKPFMPINCAAIPEELLESELFGYEAGAFTGALKARLGKIEEAAGGTLFLDEIGEMAVRLQAKLLRFLESHEFFRLGSPQLRKADVRVVTATNRDLKEESAAGRFREDLYFRLRVAELKLPPLRDRREDIPLLAANCATCWKPRCSFPRARSSCPPTSTSTAPPPPRRPLRTAAISSMSRGAAWTSWRCRSSSAPWSAPTATRPARRSCSASACAPSSASWARRKRSSPAGPKP
jgi:DNA-binding NtrC family response regulator